MTLLAARGAKRFVSQLIEILSDSSAIWTRRPGASNQAIEQLIDNCPFRLPEGYVALLGYSNGGEGPLCIEPWSIRLFPAEEVIEYNRRYKLPELLPEDFAVGDSGGEDMLAIKKGVNNPCPLFVLPFIKAESDVVEVCWDFEMFVMALGRTTDPR